MENRAGIIMAGGNGTRLKPLTNVVNKHLLPVYNKPMIFYPLSTLIRLGHKIIYLITKKIDIPLFKKLLGNGEKYGVKIIYKVQDKPKGIANCFHILKKEIRNKDVTLILGDNLFISNFENLDLTSVKVGCTIVCTTVKKPQNYGVVEIKKKIISIEEKPKKPKSNLIATGLYFFDNNVVSHLRKIKISKRGEYEITDLINEYLKKNKCYNYNLKSTDNWYDLGKIDDLIDCANFLNIYQKKRNLEIGNL